MKIYFPILLHVFLLSFFIADDVSARKIEYNDILISFVSITKDSQYTQLVDDWMQVFRPNVWENYKNDQFALNERRNEMRLFIESAISGYDPQETFDFQSYAEFGEYDFQDNVFDLHPFMSSSEFVVKSPITNSLPSSFVISFDNPDILNGLPMDASKAKNFLESRKSAGYYDKRVILNVKAVPVRVNQNHRIVMKITKIDVIDSDKSNKVIYSVQEK